MYLHLFKSNKSFIYVFYSRVAVMKPCCFMKSIEKKTLEVNEWFKDLVFMQIFCDRESLASGFIQYSRLHLPTFFFIVPKLFCKDN